MSALFFKKHHLRRWPNPSEVKYMSVLPEDAWNIGKIWDLNHRLKMCLILPSIKKKNFLSANHNHYRSLLAVFKVNSLTVITKYYYFISFELLLFRLSSSVYCFYDRKCSYSHTEKKKTKENRSPNKHFNFFFSHFSCWMRKCLS